MQRILDYLEVPAAAALVVGLGLLAQTVKAQEVDVQAGGTTVRVGPDQGTDGTSTRVRAPGVDVRVGKPRTSRGEGRVIQIGPDRDRSARKRDRRNYNRGVATKPSYWIGIAGAEVSEALQNQLGLEEGGVLVRELVPEGPAAKGGLKKFDVILNANGDAIREMDDLVDVVAEEGERGAQITFEVMRAGRQETVWVQPEVKPAPPGELNQPGFREEPGQRNGWFFGNGEQPFRFRMFGPGVMAGGADNRNIQVNGFSVQVSTVNGVSKTRVTKGDKTWEFDTEDAEAREQLPEDVRAVVDNVLNGGVDVNVDIEELLQGLPDMGGMLNEFRPGRRPQMQQRLRELERQVEELRRRAGIDPDTATNEAPGFKPNQVDSPTIEIPIEIEADEE